MRNYLFIILTVLVGCKSANQKQNIEKENISTRIDSTIKETKTEEIRLPRTELEITEGGIGKILLKESFSSIDKEFEKIDTLTMNSEGNSWPAKRIDLGNGEWILVESNDYDNSIIRLHTNSRKYKTPKGFHVGQTIGEIMKTGENVDVDIDEGFVSVRLYDEGVSVTIDSISEKQFYKSKNQSINDIPKNAKIVEFGVF